MGDTFYAICINCKIEYDTSEIGDLKCTFHPKGYNTMFNGWYYPREHWECCGISASMEDDIHFYPDCGNPNSTGCARMDHVSSVDEHWYVLNNPLILVEDTMDIKRYVTDMWKLITTVDDLHKHKLLTFDTPNGKTTTFDLEEMHARWVSTKRTDGYDPRKDIRHYYHYEYSKDMKSQATQGMKPFYIVQRVDYEVDPEIKKNRRTEERCIFYRNWKK
jgi:hypothetical protein